MDDRCNEHTLVTLCTVLTMVVQPFCAHVSLIIPVVHGLTMRDAPPFWWARICMPHNGYDEVDSIEALVVTVLRIQNLAQLSSYVSVVIVIHHPPHGANITTALVRHCGASVLRWCLGLQDKKGPALLLVDLSRSEESAQCH